MTPEQIIERARLVRAFLESDEFKAAWSGAEDDLVSEFRSAQTPEQAVRLAADFVFRETDLVRLEIVCAVGNARAQLVVLPELIVLNSCRD